MRTPHFLLDSSQKSGETINEDILLESLRLCRIGEYRGAAKIALAEKKYFLGISTRHQSLLPFVLFKCGRKRAALHASIRILLRCTEYTGEFIRVLSQSIRSSDLTADQFNHAFTLLNGISLEPNHVAWIAAHIDDIQLRELFIRQCYLRLNLSEDDLVYINAFVAFMQGNHSQALRLAQGIVASNGNVLNAMHSEILYARILANNGYYYHARKCLCHLLKRFPSNLQILDLLGFVLYHESRWKASRKIFSLVYSVSGDSISQLNSLFVMPKLAISVDELRDSLASFSENLFIPVDQLGRRSIEESLLITTPVCHSFYLAYQGSISLRFYLEGYYAVVRRIVHELIRDIMLSFRDKVLASDLKRSKVLDCTFSKRNKRIGFISRNFFQHSNLQAHEGLIRNLSDYGLDVCLLHRHESKQDPSHHDLNTAVDEVVYLSGDFGECCQQISSMSLDVLFFTDIGMYPLDSILAMARPAPVCITGWGLPHTSGLHEIDYYLRSSIFSDCESHREYSEKLVTIDGYIGYFNIDKQAVQPRTRDYYLLPPDRFLIGCLQELHKLHPDFDEYLEGIACLDESILILLPASENDSINYRFLRRIRRSAPTAHGQICLLQRMNMDDYYALNSVLDLSIDPIHYGSGITFVQTAWCGPPCVTQRGATVRSSVVSRSYEYAGIVNAPIAQDKESYIACVNHMFRQSADRQALKEQIHAKCDGTIYNNRKHLDSTAEFLLEISG